MTTKLVKRLLVLGSVLSAALISAPYTGMVRLRADAAPTISVAPPVPGELNPAYIFAPNTG